MDMIGLLGEGKAELADDPFQLPHQSLAADGLGGFGGGLPMKRALLKQEGVAV